MLASTLFPCLVIKHEVSLGKEVGNNPQSPSLGIR